MLAGQGDTLSWEVVDEREDIHYQGKRNGGRLVLAGRRKGKPFNKKLVIDHNPFYVNPKWSLAQFVLSEDKSIVFWGLRSDILETCLMRAVKKGEEEVNIMGNDVAVIRVDWTTKGIGRLFFNRTYWFRKSDGLYIKQRGSNQKTRVLVEEAIE